MRALCLLFLCYSVMLSCFLCYSFSLSVCGRTWWLWDRPVPSQGPQMPSMPVISSEQALPLPKSDFRSHPLMTVLNLNLIYLEKVSKLTLTIHHHESPLGPETRSVSATADPLSVAHYGSAPHAPETSEVMLLSCGKYQGLHEGAQFSRRTVGVGRRCYQKQKLQGAQLCHCSFC